MKELTDKDFRKILTVLDEANVPEGTKDRPRYMITEDGLYSVWYEDGTWKSKLVEEV